MVVTQDLYDIGARVREIDPSYFIVRNDETGKYELHSHRTRPTYVLSFPYGELDARSVVYVLKTKIERREALIREIEENNLKIERENERKAREKAAENIEERVSKLF